ncbi:unnamed protein product [Lactuca saligna]|uniref:Uncharacterized protein n=1 Tax=Lactuca saligna TaxID=75948 RepID=A0AA35Y7A3_LACSI|nr:unnamed protein product [Lactuca saligna]
MGVNVEDGKEDEEIEVLNNDILISESSSDEGAIKNFGSSEELKNKIKQHAVETRREIVIIKNDKNKVRAICKDSIPDLIEVGVGGSIEERKCPWVLYASKWSNDADWEVESNPTIPTGALQEQLQSQYQCEILKMKGLLHVVGTLFPCAEHRFCLRHIYENMKKQWRGSERSALAVVASSTSNSDLQALIEVKDRLLHDQTLLHQPSKKKPQVVT